MKKFVTILFLVVIALTMTYCASLLATTEKYTALVNTWNGSDVNKLITSWGPPSDVFTMPNGNKMYTWLRTGGTVVTTNYSYFLNQTTSNSQTPWCKTTFTVNKSDIIIDNTWRGNACRSY
jgi:hypothetical protein